MDPDGDGAEEEEGEGQFPAGEDGRVGVGVAAATATATTAAAAAPLAGNATANANGGGGGALHNDTTSMSDDGDDEDDDDDDDDDDSEEEEEMSQSDDDGDEGEANAAAANADASLPSGSPLFPSGSLPRDVAAALGRRALRALETRVASGDGGRDGDDGKQQQRRFEPGSPGWPGARALPLGNEFDDDDNDHLRRHRRDDFVGGESPPPSSFEGEDDDENDDEDGRGGGARNHEIDDEDGDDHEHNHFRHLFSRPLAFCVNCTAPIWPQRPPPSPLMVVPEGGGGFMFENNGEGGGGEGGGGSRMATGDGGAAAGGENPSSALPPPPPVPRLPELCPDCGRPTAPGGNDDLFSPGEQHQKQQQEVTFALPLTPTTANANAAAAATATAATTSSSLSLLPPVVLAYDDRMLGHEEARGPGRAPHPERPDRLRAAVARLLRSGVAARCSRLAAREATDAELSAVHSSALVAAVDALSLRSAARERAAEAEAAAEEAAKVDDDEEGGGGGGERRSEQEKAEVRARAAAAASRASAALAASSAAAAKANTASYSSSSSYGNGGGGNGNGNGDGDGDGDGNGNGNGAENNDDDNGNGNSNVVNDHAFFSMAGTPPGLSPDTYINPSTAGAARLAAGASADVATAVTKGLARCGLAIVRPPGHHAESNTAQGFCLFNNAAVACRAAQRAGAKRVLCFDWDMHHGNGTQAILEEDENVCYVSVHRHDGGHFYPGTGSARERGKGRGLGATLNVPWPRGGMGDADYLAALAHVVLPCCYEFNPDVVVVSAGFDACAGDPIGGCEVTPAAFAHMLHALSAVAPTVLLLEGGYNLDATAKAVEACARVALGERPPRLGESSSLGSSSSSSFRLAPQPVAMLTLHEVAVANAEHWACLRGLAGEQPFAPSAAPFARFPGGVGSGGGLIEEEEEEEEGVDESDDESEDDDGIEDLRPRGQEERLLRERRRQEKRLLLQQQQQQQQ